MACHRPESGWPEVNFGVVDGLCLGDALFVNYSRSRAESSGKYQ
jgi:hypothetical protein